MEPALIHLVVAAGCFVGSHFLMSGPARRSLASRLGAQGFLLLYTVVSITTFGWTIVAFDRAPSDWMLWNGMSALPWAFASILTIVALALLIPSFVRNPALPARSAAGVGTWIPVGVFRVTRHPMMWGISLWALGHLIVTPTPRVLVLMSALILLALLGSHFQDKRKLAQNTREFAPWQRRTSFGLRLGELPGLGSLWLLAFLVWFVATWLHYHLFGIPAGLWFWIG
jgi:uncharacterized membrane protein